jgi:hypothetical protein
LRGSTRFGEMAASRGKRTSQRLDIYGLPSERDALETLVRET